MDRELLSRLVNKNYHSIKGAARCLVKDSSLIDDLISETYITIERRNSNLPKDDEGFIKVFVTLMKIQTYSERDGFLKLTRPKDKLINDFDRLDITDDKELDVDSLIKQILVFKSELNALELVLFELHYEQGLTLTAIIKLYSDRYNEMSFNCLWKMYTPLKLKIKKYKWIF